LDLYSDSSLKQQYAVKHVASFCCCDKKYLLITVTLPVFDGLLLIELFVLLNCLVFIGLTFFLILLHHINGVMVSVLIWSAVDCGFEHRLGKTKEKKLVLV
jgi:hypothetical protein